MTPQRRVQGAMVEAHLLGIVCEHARSSKPKPEAGMPGKQSEDIPGARIAEALDWGHMMFETRRRLNGAIDGCEHRVDGASHQSPPLVP
jgi:hypothetical protein